VKLYQKKDVNETLSSTLEIVLRQVRVPIPQSKILQREYRKRELAVDGDQREYDLETRVTANGDNKTPRCFTVVH